MDKKSTILLSDLLTSNVRCDLGIDHGRGFCVWMHPPVHRILGWASRPSTLKLSLDVWRLNQLKGLDLNNSFVKGKCSISDQVTINRFPTLINAILLNKNSQKIGTIVDFVFEYKTGKILYYLVSRTNPKIPGTSRWSLQINDISDQQPGRVITNLNSINDLPLIRTSIREDLLQKSKSLRSQVKEFTNTASNKLEGWLEESPWEDSHNKFTNYSGFSNNQESDDLFDSFNEYTENIDIQNIDKLEYDEEPYTRNNQDSDPWI